MRWIDSHCHLDEPGLVERIEEVLEAARRAGVAAVVTIATRRARWEGVLELAERFAEVWAVLGVHPHHAHEDRLPDAGPLLAALSHPKVVGIGEAGLDYHYGREQAAAQERNFRIHIEAARESGLPLVVHSRSADEATWRVLAEEHRRGAFGCVLHCFSSSKLLAERLIGLGFMLGIGGILTFKRSEELRATVAGLPLSHLLLETDAPYLAPVPHRGRTNQPAYLVETARTLAAIRGLALDQVAEATTANALRLFSRLRLDGEEA